MTDEELEQAIREVNEKLSGFGPEKSLTNKEWRDQIKLKQEKDLLMNIKKSRENGNAIPGNQAYGAIFFIERLP